MKKIVLASVGVFVLSAGAALAENPNFGVPPELQPNPPAGYGMSPPTGVYGAPSVSIERMRRLPRAERIPQRFHEEQGQMGGYSNPAMNRFGDASPGSSGY